MKLNPLALLMACLCLLASRSAAQSSAAAELSEATLHGFPAMLDLQGRKLADGEFVQWLANGVLYVTIDYDLGDGHRIEEQTSFRQLPSLAQEAWSWSESKEGRVLRHFEVDFKTGKATAEKRLENKHWSEDIKVEPGKTFAGFGFVLAIKSVRGRLLEGQTVQLQAVGFTPKPRVVSVDLSFGGLDQMKMANRVVKGDRFVIRPKIPAIAKAFFTVKDTHIWLTRAPAVSFLRWEGPMVEADDSVIRVDLLPGEQSGAAEPAAQP